MKALDSQKYWEELLERSEDEPVIIFKHSNSCGGSLSAFRELKTLENDEEVDSHIFIVIVQHAREISDDISEKLGLKHESPQVILIRKGKVVYNADHGDIDSKKLLKEYNKFAS
jgi:bacillithiol system protein YtxJ